ncbi:DUF4427 domain-containing protein [Pseudomonas violetae]|uniref:DUF4427 domain-containing protein n=1 Tax=Pseudomonas violetae TaxID=2915813 RepID=A0ABT0F115_9PSED|nr:DUF4427 domain-containing protein [Pseudomonas violetae]MCK1791691.1 DUF4427 domain-containing protein [Pseudomonas violetae]
MPEENSRSFSRVAHYFRNVDLSSDSSPDFIPEGFWSGCCVEAPYWPALILLREAIRSHHIWATFGIRNGRETINGTQPAVCFSGFNVADLIAVRDGLSAADEHATQYAITFHTRSAELAGAEQVVRGGNLRAFIQKESGLGFVPEADVVSKEFRYIDVQLDLFREQTSQPEWRWPYTGDYRRAVTKIEEEGYEANPIPGLDFAQGRWGGIGVVVSTEADALRLQYDMLSLIDQGLVPQSHFDHLLICDRLPASLNGLSESKINKAARAACFDFRSCMSISDEAAAAALEDFTRQLSTLEISTSKRQIHELGGCWVSFQDNTHPYVRALLKTGRVVVNKKGRYLGNLNELDPRRDLRERQEMVKILCQQLKEEHGVACCYYSVRNSWRPDGSPFYCGKPWSGLHRITDEPDEEDED